MASDKVDWKKAKKDYIVNEKSYREIAEEYGVSAAFINRKGKAENWGEQRKQYVEKTFAKTLDKISDKESDALAAHYKANDLMVKLLVQILEDEELRALYLAEEKSKKTSNANTNENTTRCVACGELLAGDARFCSCCGAVVGSKNTTEEPNKRKVVYEGEIHKCPIFLNSILMNSFTALTI